MPAPLVSGLQTAIEKDVYRLTYQRYDNDCHIRVWRRTGRIIERAKSNQAVVRGAATKAVKGMLATGSEGTSFKVKQRSAQHSERLGLAPILEEAEDPESKLFGAEQIAQQLRRVRDEQDRQVASTLLPLPPGTWRCSACNKELSFSQALQRLD